MKAGIFKTTDNMLLYVGKDQYIRAVTGHKINLLGTKVIYSKGRDLVASVVGQLTGSRVANVRNGFNRDPLRLLLDLGQRIENPDVLDLSGNKMRYEAEDANDDNFGLKVDEVNPVEALRYVAGQVAESLGVEVDHESFDKFSAHCDQKVDVAVSAPKKPRRVPIVVPPVRLVAMNNEAVAEQDPELAAYHGEADEADREAINKLPDDVSPAQSLKEFVGERLHRLKGTPYSFDLVEKPTDLSADGLREILAQKEEIQKDIARVLGMPKELAMPYGEEKKGVTDIGGRIMKAMTRHASSNADGKMIIVAPDVETRDEAKALVEQYRNYYNQFTDLAIDIFTPDDLRANPITVHPNVTTGWLVLSAGHHQVPLRAEDARKTTTLDFETYEKGGIGTVGLREGETAVRLSEPQRYFYANEDEERAHADLAAGKFRLCHAASARKHKKKGDRIVWWHPVFGCYAWHKLDTSLAA